MSAAIDFGDTIIKKARTFARIAHPVNFFGTADSCDERAAQQSLEIQREIGTNPSGFLQPRQQAPGRAEASELTARKEVDVVHVRISAEQRRELGINDPSNLSARMRLAKQSYRRERVDDVAERTRLDNQDRFRIQSFRLQGSEFGGPACVKATARQKSAASGQSVISSPNRQPLCEQPRQARLDDLLLRGGEIIF